MQQGSKEQNALRTRVYVDGYNLYYGCLKRSLEKWLDPRALIECILPTILYEQNGEPVRYRFQTPAIKYFTAPILEAFAKSDDSVACQSHYHAALEGQLQGEVQIIKGYHDARPARAHRWEEGKAARECDKIEIWKLEEKQSDVALALHAYSDAIRNEVDQIIVLTNDTDFAPAARMIRGHTPSLLASSHRSGLGAGLSMQGLRSTPIGRGNTSMMWNSHVANYHTWFVIRAALSTSRSRGIRGLIC